VIECLRRRRQNLPVLLVQQPNMLDGCIRERQQRCRRRVVECSPIFALLTHSAVAVNVTFLDAMVATWNLIVMASTAPTPPVPPGSNTAHCRSVFMARSVPVALLLG